MKDKITELKEAVHGWETSLLLRKTAYNQTRIDLKKAQEDLKHEKRCKNWAYKQVTEAKRELKKAKSRLSAYPSRVRQWNKNHMEKIL
jgi:hypothetical protein